MPELELLGKRSDYLLRNKKVINWNMTYIFMFLILIFVLSTAAGVSAILISFGMYKKYRFNYLASYLYFIIFQNSFGFFGLLGLVLAQVIFKTQTTSSLTIQTSNHLFAFITTPFLIAADYMFLKLFWELMEKKLPKTITWIYFSVQTIFFLGYGTVIARLVHIPEDQHVKVSTIIGLAYFIIDVLVVIAAISQVFPGLKSLRDRNKRKAVKIFSYIHIFVVVFSYFLFFIATRHLLLVGLYLVTFFAGQLPALLYWKHFLAKYQPEYRLQPDKEVDITPLFEKYNISKREAEIIGLICEGKSNKEIEDVLYISLQTVKDHVHRIYKKAGVKNRVQLTNLFNPSKMESPHSPIEM